MHIQAFPTRLVAVSDGACRGQEHILLYLEHLAFQEIHAFALSPADARALLLALSLVLADQSSPPSCPDNVN